MYVEYHAIAVLQSRNDMLLDAADWLAVGKYGISSRIVPHALAQRSVLMIIVKKKNCEPLNCV